MLEKVALSTLISVTYSYRRSLQSHTESELGLLAPDQLPVG